MRNFSILVGGSLSVYGTILSSDTKLPPPPQTRHQALQTLLPRGGGWVKSTRMHAFMYVRHLRFHVVTNPPYGGTVRNGMYVCIDGKRQPDPKITQLPKNNTALRNDATYAASWVPLHVRTHEDRTKHSSQEGKNDKKVKKKKKIKHA